jgi:3-deoxy-D-manno-octulosonate 8-phosphate phosphatase (KDO 8-P phosphatase)
MNHTDKTELTRLQERLARIRLLAMDVDGVLTDGTFAYDSEGGEHKSFHVADGLGIVLLRLTGIEVAWISGRASAIVERRGQELGIRHIVQGVRDKNRALRALCDSLAMPLEEVAYIGDDWNDLPALQIVGVAIATANAAEEVKRAADFVTYHAGGQGAVREVCMQLIDACGSRETCLKRYIVSLSEAEEKESEGRAGQ